MMPTATADRRSRVLLTNDDGVDSSLLVPFIEAMYDAMGGPSNLSIKVGLALFSVHHVI